ncbi:hypothetical protein BOQ54_18880 (plasmid) [Chelatococcus daeguensis]|uniref:Uncharacterized protein n=1 Tax=Chelatococcus daeguensis TaxID=444444 RepID=A0AAC9P0W8_9HYPH|nr:hypothetical protein [Chelatococcus daeguensis]APF39545.1 hypothetical protein BOQ54_18880 [Chelatococcus daeguensis]
MNRDDFEQLRRRFGEDVAAWPPPYRQEARSFQEDNGTDDDLDRLLRAAIDAPADERALARKVLSRIEGSRRPAHVLSASLRHMPSSAVAACLALVLMVAAAAGYRLGERGPEAANDTLLAFAAGEPSGLDDIVESLGSVGDEL